LEQKAQVSQEYSQEVFNKLVYGIRRFEHASDALLSAAPTSANPIAIGSIGGYIKTFAKSYGERTIQIERAVEIIRTELDELVQEINVLISELPQNEQKTVINMLNPAFELLNSLKTPAEIEAEKAEPPEDSPAPEAATEG